MKYQFNFNDGSSQTVAWLDRGDFLVKNGLKINSDHAAFPHKSGLVFKDSEVVGVWEGDQELAKIELRL